MAAITGGPVSRSTPAPPQPAQRRQCATPRAVATPAEANTEFIARYSRLREAVAPASTSLHAALTPLGRGLVAGERIGSSATVLSG